MRTALLFLLFITTVTVVAQDILASQVPATVTKAMATSYPTATEVRWEKKNDQFKADFKIEKTDHDVWFDKDGRIMKHRQEVKHKDLPAAILQVISKDYAGYKADDCEKTEENGTVVYKVELKSPTDKKNINFDETGKVIPKKKDK